MKEETISEGLIDLIKEYPDLCVYADEGNTVIDLLGTIRYAFNTCRELAKGLEHAITDIEILRSEKEGV